MEVRYTAQFWIFSPRTRRNSLSLFVTNVNPATTACAAIQRSLFPIISPLASNSARIDLYASGEGVVRMIHLKAGSLRLDRLSYERLR